MKKGIFLSVFILIIIVAIFLIIYFSDTNEKIIDNQKNNEQSGEESLSNNNGSYDIEIYDDMIVIYDKDGNLIVYSFEDDHLSNIQQLILGDANNNLDTDMIKSEFQDQIDSGVIEKLTVQDNNIVIVYNLDYFSEFKDCTLEEFKDILLGQATILNEEVIYE